MKKFASDIKTMRPLNVLFMLVAGILSGIAVTMFLAPVHLYDSGLSGTSMLLWKITPDTFKLWFFIIVLNLPFFLFGAKKQGAAFTIYSLIAIVTYSATTYLVNNVLPIDVSSSSPFAGTDILLCAVFGGMIAGIGSGLSVRFGGAIDGIEVMAVIFAKRLGLTVGTFIMIYNAILYIIAGAIMKSWITPLYSIITYMVGVKTIDFIVDGLDKAKSAMIITEKPEEICAEISDTFGRGITLMKAHGYYSTTSKTMVYFVVNRFQIAKLKRTVRAIDPNAFVTISEVSDVMGKSVKE